MKNTNSIRRLVFAALMAALCYVATVMFRVPTPTGGYINLGDGFVLLSGFLLGPWVGGIAAGLGSALSDLLAGYTAYVPGTFFIKALDAMAAALLYRALLRTALQKTRFLPAVLAGVLGEIVMVFGYFFYESLILGYGLSAAVEIGGNALQGCAGIVVSTVLSTVLLQVPYIRNTMRGLNHAN